MHPDLAPPWVHQPLPRPVALGRTWFRVPVPFWVCNVHHTQLPHDPAGIDLPLDGDPGALGAYIRNQPVPAPLPVLSDYQGYLRYVPYGYERSILRKQGRFEDYLKKFDGKARYNLRRSVKKFQEASGAGTTIFRVFEEPEEMPEFHAAAAALAATTYQAKLYADALPATPEFLAELVQLAHARKQLGALLYHQGRPAAYWWGLRVGPWFASEYMGFDASLEQLSPGTVLQMLFYEHVFGRDDIAGIDFGEQDLQYKRHFRTEVQHIAEAFYLRRDLRGQGFLRLEQVLRGLREVHKPVLAELRRRGWLGKFRRFVSQ
jgi:CelD/BcsL family acetyltransferase involved in cellulose biosynthesis